MLLHQFVNGALEAMHPTIQKDTTFTKIFVGGLPYHTNDASLKKYFEAFGEIEEAVVITDRQTGKSRGYGFVTMTDRGAAERACKDPNPIIDGRKANVNLAYLGAKPRSMQTAMDPAPPVPPLPLPQAMPQSNNPSQLELPRLPPSSSTRPSRCSLTVCSEHCALPHHAVGVACTQRAGRDRATGGSCRRIRTSR
ncbi:hypothetical protein JZ751_014647, partial [Albula glossodonta]